MRAPSRGSPRASCRVVAPAVAVAFAVAAGGAGTACDRGHPADRGVLPEGPGLPAAPRSLRLLVGAPDAPATFTSGWTAPNGETPPARWSWAKKSIVEFEFRPNAAAYLLEIEGRQVDGPPQTIDVTLNGRAIGTVHPRLVDATMTLPVPPGVLTRGHGVLELAYGWTKPLYLIDPPSHDSHPIAVSVRTIAFVPVPSAAVVEVGTAAGRAALASGWSVDEGAADARFAWSDAPRSRISFIVAPEPGAYEIAVTGRPAVPHLDVVVNVDGQPRGVLAFDAAGGTAKLMIPPGALAVGANDVELVYGTVVRPADLYPGARDVRTLALALTRFAIAPAAAAAAAP